MKIRGNFIKVAKSIMFDGLSAGGAEIRVPKAEKQKAAIMTPKTKGMLMISPPSRMIPAKKTKDIMISPKITEATISPKIIAQRLIGEDISLSKVFIFVSQGAITGVMAETAKNKAIPKSPGNKNSTDISLFNENATNKKAGINSPWISTGPLR